MIDTIIVTDTETSDLPENGGALLEVATVAVWREDGKWHIGDSQSWLIEHDGPIAPGAQAAHHITPDMVRPGTPGVDTRDDVLHAMIGAETPELIYCAHHAVFDKQFLPELTRPWIDTCQCAKHIWPESPSFNNQVLRYFVNVFPPEELMVGSHPHRATYDAATTAALLQRMLVGHTPEQLLELSERPAIQLTIKFGKYRGTQWAYAPRDYLGWLRDKSDMYRDDPEIRATVDHYLKAS